MSNQKVWFITGSNSGFGRSLTEAVLEKGDKVVATTRHTENVQDLADKYGDQVKITELDITDTAQISSAIETAIETFGGVDVLVNNAGYGTLGAVEEISDDLVRKQFEVNCFGTLNLTKGFLPHFRQRKSGHILNVSSVGGVTAFAGTGIYCSTKFAIEGYSEALAQEVGPLGIKITLVEPGAFRTEFAGGSLTTAEDTIDDYKETAHKFVKTAQETSGQQPGDPDKAAQAMIQVVYADNPPMRLILGEDALEGVRNKIQSIQKDMEDWEDVSRNMAFPGAKTNSLG